MRDSLGVEPRQFAHARLEREPADAAITQAVGATAIVVYSWQIRLAVRGGFADSLRLGDMGRRTPHFIEVWACEASWVTVPRGRLNLG